MANGLCYNGQYLFKNQHHEVIPMRTFQKASKLNNVLYDVRGPVVDEATRMEENGMKILKLNIGNPAPFGFTAPEEVIQDIRHNVVDCQGYSDSRGIFAARKAVMQYAQIKNIPNVTMKDVYTGNGASELITMSLQGLLNYGDEILVPSPDYPLWTASVTLAGGTAVHYICDEQANWNPDLDDIKKKITDRTKAIVIINPNKMVELYSFKENHKVIMTENGRVFEPFDVCNVIINPCSLIVLGKEKKNV